MEQFQLNPEQKKRLTGHVKEAAAAAVDLKLKAGGESGTLIRLKNLRAKLEELKDASNPEILKYNLVLRRQIAEKWGASFVSNFQNGAARVFIKGNFLDKDPERSSDRWILLNEQGEDITNGKRYKKISDFHEGLASVQEEKSDSFYYINEKGERVFGEQEFKFAGDFNDGLAKVSLDKGFSFINKKGEVVFKGDFDSVWDFNDGFLRVNKNGKSYFVNKKGKIAFKNQKIVAREDFKDGWTVVEKKKGILNLGSKHNYKLMNTKGEFFPTEGECYQFRGEGEGLLAVGEKKKISDDISYYFYNLNGKKAFNGEYFITIRAFSEGLAAVSKKGTGYYFIDKHGERVFDKSFREARSFSNGFAAVKGYYNEGWYFIDKKANDVFPDLRFDDFRDFKDGVAQVKQGRLWFYIDIHGKRIFD